MKIIKGYVLILSTEITQFLLGKGIGSEPCRSLTMNGLVPFETFEEATQAKAFRERRPPNDMVSVEIARIQLKLAESEEEWDVPMQNSRSLIVISQPKCEEVFLIGRSVPGKPMLGGIPAANLEQNGLKPITSFSAAQHIAREFHRQTLGCSVGLATFYLRKVTPKK